ncbi:MAG TPA: ABC transporter ATP-binding protein [Clostridia bacterium]|nr:ABC transporter ATP-binding protein [Clostridia bacterium]
MIEVDSLTKRYGDKTSVDGLSLTVPDNAITILLGPSGCGKTTTLKMINRLIEPTSGDIRIDGRSVYSMDPIELRRSIGYVIQEIGLFPHYTVEGNIGVVPRLLGWDRSRIRRRAQELLELVNLDPSVYLGRYPRELSGGERQRVGVARALAADPHILLMDEPFGAIDPINRRSLQDFFLRLQSDLKRTVVFVTHDIGEAVKLGDYIAVMRDGRLVQMDATRALLEHPADTFVEDLLGATRSVEQLLLYRAAHYVDTAFTVMTTEEMRRSDLQAEAPLIIVKDGDVVSGYVEAGQFVTCEGPEPAVCRPDIISGNATLLEAVSTLLESGHTRAVVQDPDGTILGTLSVPMVVDIMAKVAR